MRVVMEHMELNSNPPDAENASTELEYAASAQILCGSSETGELLKQLKYSVSEKFINTWLGLEQE